MKYGYREGHKNGKADRLLGRISVISLTAPDTEYARGYRDAVYNVVHYDHNRFAACKLGCPGCGMLFDPCEKAENKED